MLELLEKFPKAAKVVKQYYLEKLIESLDATLPEDFREHVREQGITDEVLAKIVGEAPRMVFDVFDENGIYISIGVFAPASFKYQINDLLIGPVFRYSEIFKNRKEAEKAAVEKAFKLLNEKL